jgi:hypothetical protein
MLHTTASVNTLVGYLGGGSVRIHQGAETVHTYLLLGLLERGAREWVGLLLRKVPAPLLKNVAIFVAQAKTLADFEGPSVLME